MSKCGNQKLKILYLLQFLHDQSDPNHPASMEQLLSYLAENGISAERKSIYSDIDALRSFGVDVELRKARPAGYYLVSPRGKQKSPSSWIGPIVASSYNKGGGNLREIQLECTAKVFPVMEKHLGKGSAQPAAGGDRFLFTAAALVTPQFFAWLFSLGESVRLLGPEDAVEQMKAQLQKTAELYS